MAAPRYPVDGPRPVAPKFGLIQAAQVVEMDDEHWLNGVDVRPYPCDLADVWAPCLGTATTTKLDGEPVTMADYDVLTVYLAVTCGSRTMGSPADLINRATVAFAAREGWALEREFWTGDLLPTNPHLTDANADIISGTFGLVDGLAALEQAIADSGSAGFIHADWATVSAWSSNFQVFREGASLVTALGTTVVPGAGYNGFQPDGQGNLPAGSSWAFATGPVQLVRSNSFTNPTNIAEALERTQNDVTFRVERYYIASWDGCLQAAALIDRTP